MKTGLEQILSEQTESTTLSSICVESSTTALDLEPAFALIVLFSDGEPARAGELLQVPAEHSDSPFVLGRGLSTVEDGGVRLLPILQRPGQSHDRNPFTSQRLSRRQLLLRLSPRGLEVENVGRAKLSVNNVRVNQATLHAGDVLRIGSELLLLVTTRPAELPALRHYPSDLVPFPGDADPFGMVGESAAAWRLREACAFVAGRQGHVLINGESGTGKEIVASTVHGLSKRSVNKLVSRNAATFPASLIDAELFGNAANYPNPGMPARPGLLGASHGSSLFLDEVGELPIDLQTHLLRFLDEDGDYQRLGESISRCADVRFIGATNRGLIHLKPDLAARLKLRIDVPNLNQRREDIPLIARYLLKRTTVADPEMGAQFFANWDGQTGEPRIGIGLLDALTRHHYVLHVRELEALLWCSAGSSSGDWLDLTPEVEARFLANPLVQAGGLGSTRDRVLPDRATLEEALSRHSGVHERVWRELGLNNRYVLRRLLKKYGIESTSAAAIRAKSSGGQG